METISTGPAGRLPEREGADPLRDRILAWGRSTRLFRDVVQTYRFERWRGGCPLSARQAAADFVAEADPSVADPLTYAVVLIQWSEREHRQWFWRCCRDHHVV